MCVLFKKRIEDPAKKTAAKGMCAFSFQIVFLIDGNSGKDAEGLPQNGKTAEGNEERNQCQPQPQIIGRAAQQIGAVGHFQ